MGKIERKVSNTLSAKISKPIIYEQKIRTPHLMWIGLIVRTKYMSKPGDEYQEIVGLVRQALDPNANVKTGQWIEGPDGQRDLDVEVRGVHDGKEQFVLIECKDWKRKVGIETVDALESKRRDLGADDAAIYSNSGFTSPALQKAKRVGIRMFSALRQDDKRIRYVVYREVVASKLSVDNFSIRAFSSDKVALDLPKGLQPTDIRYKDLPLINFLHDESKAILMDQNKPATFIVFYVFHNSEKFDIGDEQMEIQALQLTMRCSEKYVSQVVQENVTLGHYDFFNETVAIPDQQVYKVGTFDMSKWVDVDTDHFQVKSRDPRPNTFTQSLMLYFPISGIKDVATPNLSECVKSREIHVG